MIDLETINTGLSQGEFFLEYMPTVSLIDGRCIGAEALIRWRRPTGIVTPTDFIPIAENTPLLGSITYWVIETVAAELSDWLRANPDAHLSINVPPEILGRGGIRYVAERNGLMELASQIILEITERGVPDAIGVAAINQSMFRQVRVALDDVTFVGGGNLAVLVRCHFSIVKLDKTLVAQIGPECPAPEWLETIVAFLGSSEVVVIAEGVETEQQVEVLRAAGIQAAQGFYFSTPLPANEFMAFHLENTAFDVL